MKLHIRDIRLYNNAGIDFPVCRAQEKLLDMEVTRYPMAIDPRNATCKHCHRAYAQVYPWVRS